PADRGAVKRGDYRNRNGRFYATQVLEIFIRSGGQQWIRKIRFRFCRGAAMTVAVEVRRHLLAGDLFFIERAQNQCGGARVFELLYVIEIVRQRARSADDQWVWQRHSEICRRQIHCFTSPFPLGFPLLPASPFPSVAAELFV